MYLWSSYLWRLLIMKKVRSPKDMKVKRKNDASRPSVKSGIYSNPKPERTKLPEKVGTTLDDEFTIELIKLL